MKALRFGGGWRLQLDPGARWAAPQTCGDQHLGRDQALELLLRSVGKSST